MNYKRTLEFLYSQLPAYHRIGKAAYKSDLHNIVALDGSLGRPHTEYKTIHIAGTNGKGSVSHMLASVLMEAGYKTGLYTSPHIVEFRERIRVNGSMIPEGNVTRFVADHSDLLISLKPSFFEMSVAMAFEYFRESQVDIAVIETGLGGRLDSTNIITPVVSVITNIGHDHMDLLGDTLEKVAWEKAGIIKKGIPVIISESQKDSADVFLKKSSETGSEIFFADKNYKCHLGVLDYISKKRKYSVNDLFTSDEFIGETPLGGDYQAMNIQAVFQTCSILGKIFGINDGNIISGISKVVKNTGLMGRWQIMDKDPLVICDTGHNREGLEYVVSQLKKLDAKKLHIVLGFVSDKDIGSVLPIFPVSAEYYFTKASVPRALDENILYEKAASFGLKGRPFPDVKSALSAAKTKSSKADAIFIGGSTFVVADALQNP